ncbi:MAG: hypothetical protein U0234_06640 [Sandaracinus sp.]
MAKKSRDKRISGPLVLAASSAMIAVGIAALFAIDVPDEVAEDEAAREEYAALVIDDRTPERVAESYLDAWRRRAWDQAASISIGEAHERALTKQAMDQDVEHDDRVMAREVWERLASSPLSFEWQRAEVLDDRGGLYLHAIASYQFMGHPYRRMMSWVVRPEGELFRVERMENGQVLTEIPDILQGVDL